MRPRLEAARTVLADTGALFCSIDDNEVAHLRLLLDEVFGERNFVAQVVVNLNPKGRQLGSFFATSHEYLLVYARDEAAVRARRELGVAGGRRDFPLAGADGRRYRHLPLRNTNKKFNPVTARTLHFPMWGDPDTGRWPPTRSRARSRSSRSSATAPGGVALVGAADRRPPRRPGLPPDPRPAGGAGRHLPEGLAARGAAQEDQDDLAGRGGRLDRHRGRRAQGAARPVFESPKPTGLVRRVLECFPADARVLDFFAGSGTTGHATALANAADGGSRTCLSVNSAEPTREGSNARNAGYLTVSAITRARLERVADGRRRACGPLTGGPWLRFGPQRQDSRIYLQFVTNRCTPESAAPSSRPAGQNGEHEQTRRPRHRRIQRHRRAGRPRPAQGRLRGVRRRAPRRADGRARARRACTRSRWTSPTTPRWWRASSG